MRRNAEVTIRPATAADVGAIGLILRELGWFAHMNEESPADTGARIVRQLELCGADDSHTVLVAENSENAVVGYVAAHWLPYLMLAGPEGYVSELFVLESERGKGIGGNLLKAVRAQASARGCVRLQLVTGRERMSYEMYKKLGWNERPGIANFVLPL